jgi:hypothetical protein
VHIKLFRRKLCIFSHQGFGGKLAFGSGVTGTGSSSGVSRGRATGRSVGRRATGRSVRGASRSRRLGSGRRRIFATGRVSVFLRRLTIGLAESSDSLFLALLQVGL